MDARTTTVQADPSKIDDGIANIRDAVTPVITAMDGCVGMSMLADRVRPLHRHVVMGVRSCAAGQCRQGAPAA